MQPLTRSQLRDIHDDLLNGQHGVGWSEQSRRRRVGKSWPTFWMLLTARRGIFFFVGPLLLTLGLIFEWIMGNFFSMMVMGLFAVFWLSFGLLQLPTLALTSAYSATGDAAEGAASVGYNATIALYLIVWGFALLTFFIFTLKTNIIFAGIFFFVTIAVWVLSGAYWKVASGDYVTAGQLQKVRPLPTQHAEADIP